MPSSDRPRFLQRLIDEAGKQGVTAYQLSKRDVMSLSQAQRFLAGDLNPTASTCDAVARALGMKIEAEKR